MTDYSMIYRFSKNYLKRSKYYLAASVVFMFLSVIADVIMPIYAGRLTDLLANDGLNPNNMPLMITAFFLFIGINLFHFIVYFLSRYVWQHVMRSYNYDVVTENTSKLMRFNSDWHANAFSGASVRKILRGAEDFDRLVDVIFNSLLPAFVMLVSMMIMLLYRVPLVGLVTLPMILLYIFISIWISVTLLRPRFQIAADADTDLGAALADTISGNPTVKAFAAEEREESLLRTVSKNWSQSHFASMIYYVGADLFRNILRLFILVGMIGSVIYLWQKGQAAPGDAVLVITSFFVLGAYLRNIGDQIAMLQRSASGMKDIVEIWQREDDVHDAVKAVELKPEQAYGDIVFDQVCFSYPNGTKVYDHFSVCIKAGENVALVGISGSGKSTFVKLLQRLYNVTDGRILIGGQDISEVTLKSLRRSVSLVPQDPILFHRTLADNIAYGKPDATMDEIINVAKRAQIHDFISNLPKGYDTLVGERGIKLSGGERQRVAIARAMLLDAPVLILDEATSSLDSISESYIQQAVSELVRGRTSITIAHRLSTVRRADRILVFSEGKIIEDGPHDALMNRPGSLYKKLFDMQVLGLQD